MSQIAEQGEDSFNNQDYLNTIHLLSQVLEVSLIILFYLINMSIF